MQFYCFRLLGTLENTARRTGGNFQVKIVDGLCKSVHFHHSTVQFKEEYL
jgi:hypothetical protein